MRTFLFLLLCVAAAPGQADIYKWTDPNGLIHYSDRPQDGSKAETLRHPAASGSSTTARDDWRERDRASREAQARRGETERRAATQAAAQARQAPYNPSANRSNRAMTDDEVCRRDQQQIEFAEKTKHLNIIHGGGMPEQLSETQRQEVIRERKSNHALTCGNGVRR